MADVLVLLRGWVESRRGEYHTMTLDLAIAEIERLRVVERQRNDLLAALVDLIGAVEGMGVIWSEDDSHLRPAITKARAAAARATGREV